MTTVWNSIALERMPRRTDVALFCALLYSQHQKQCLALGMKEKRKGEMKRDARPVLVDL